MAEVVGKVEPIRNSLIASAARTGKGGTVSWSKVQRSQSEIWQRQAWDFYKTIGEFRYACDWVGAMLSKAVLFATNEVNGRAEHVNAGPAAEYMAELFGDTDGKAEMLRLIGIHMSVTGECFLVGYEKVEENDEGIVVTQEDHWEVVAATELRNSGSKKNPIWHANGRRLDVENHADVYVIRIWRPDPEKPDFAISPARAILSTLGELFKLSEHVAAQVDSRLAGAGILLMPTEMTFPTPTNPDGTTVTEAPNTAQGLMDVIQDAMATAIEDRSDPSALVPIVITAPGEVIDKVRHITFWSELDEKAIELRNEAIRRLALGMDMPPEVLTGVGDSTHWNAWQADESAIKAHTEPLLKIITTALAAGYLRPLLAATPGMKDQKITGYSIKADTSEMRLRPNRSKEALELHALGLLTDEALLRETGFDPIGDKMSDEQRQVWFLRKIASGSTTPAQVEAAMRIMFPTVKLNTEDGEAESQEARPVPSLKDHPTRELPDPELGERRKQARDEGRVPSAASLMGAEQIVFRALERAGNRMRNKVGGKTTGVSAANTYLTYSAKASELDSLLEDALGENVGALARHMGMETQRLSAIIDGYLRSLLVSQKEHSYETLERHFALALSEDLVAS